MLKHDSGEAGVSIFFLYLNGNGFNVSLYSVFTDEFWYIVFKVNPVIPFLIRVLFKMADGCY